jgi:hypothetical protein
METVTARNPSSRALRAAALAIAALAVAAAAAAGVGFGPASSLARNLLADNGVIHMEHAQVTQHILADNGVISSRN